MHKPAVAASPGHLAMPTRGAARVTLELEAACCVDVAVAVDLCTFCGGAADRASAWVHRWWGRPRWQACVVSLLLLLPGALSAGVAWLAGMIVGAALAWDTLHPAWGALPASGVGLLTLAAVVACARRSGRAHGLTLPRCSACRRRGRAGDLALGVGAGLCVVAPVLTLLLVLAHVWSLARPPAWLPASMLAVGLSGAVLAVWLWPVLRVVQAGRVDVVKVGRVVCLRAGTEVAARITDLFQAPSAERAEGPPTR